MAEILSRARAFLEQTQGLTPEEAQQALTVAAQVLRAGLARMTRAVATQTPTEGAEAAHALKGNLLNLGLAELARTAQKAYEQAQNGDLRGCAAACDILPQALKPLLDGLPD